MTGNLRFSVACPHSQAWVLIPSQGNQDPMLQTWPKFFLNRETGLEVKERVGGHSLCLSHLFMNFDFASGEKKRKFR